MANRWAKQKIHMFKSLLVIVGALGIGAPTFAQVTIKAGQTWTFGFQSLADIGSQAPNPFLLGTASVALFVAGNQATLTLDLFENTLSDPPLIFHLTNQPNVGPLSAITRGIWGDRQGWIRLHVDTGELKVNSVAIGYYGHGLVDFIEYYESTFYVAQPVLNEVLLTNSAGILQSTLQWSTNTVGYALQSSAFCDSGPWNDVTNQPVVVGSLYSVSVDALGPQRFYRLINR